jgi:hypothetical protein
VREFGNGYDQTLEVFSRPFMRRYDTAHRFGEMLTYDDGVRSNLMFDAYEDANYAWRYPDLTDHVIYTAHLVAHTIRHEMADEARVLVRFQLAQQRIKNVLEMPDPDAVQPGGMAKRGPGRPWTCGRCACGASAATVDNAPPRALRHHRRSLRPSKRSSGRCSRRSGNST